MKIELQEGTDDNGLPIHHLFINGEADVYIQDLSDCPEDAHIGRDLIDGRDIIDYMTMAYLAGKKGEGLDVVFTDLEEV